MSRFVRSLRSFIFLAAAFLALVFGAPSARASAPVIPAGAVASLPPLPADHSRIFVEGFELSYPTSTGERALAMKAELLAQRARMTELFGRPVLETATIRIVRSPEELAALAPMGLPPPAFAVGVAYPRLRVILVSLTVPRTFEASELSEVMAHELSHLALSDAIGVGRAPRWFDDGLAIHLSGEHRLARTRSLWTATVAGALLPVAELDRHFFEGGNVELAYAQSGDLVRYMLRDEDRARFIRLIRLLHGGDTLDRALIESYSTDLRRIELEWKNSLDRRYSVIPAALGGVIWASMLGLLVAAYVRRKRQARAKLARWDAEEKAEERLLAVLSPTVENTSELAPKSLIARAETPRVEHKGRWHTLH